MDRRTFLKTATALPVASRCCALAEEAAPAAVVEPHFPSAAHQFVWRNWDLVPVERIARAMACETDAVVAIARTMGLELPQPRIDQPMRTWLLLLRRNWYFAPFEQIAILLDKTVPEIRAMMIPFNFVENHLGPKPECPMIRVNPGDVESGKPLPHFRMPDHDAAGEAPFTFLDALAEPLPPEAWPGKPAQPALEPRIIFPCTSMYGEDLNAQDMDSSYPDGVLANLARMGLDAIWVHGLLRELVPSDVFPEFGHGGEQRVERLNQLVARARRHGLGVYVFLNEPRGMPEEFFERNPEVKGAPGRPTDVLRCLCTSTDRVKAYLAEASERLLERVPGIEGVILITASEAPTNCYSLYRKTPCPRCAERTGPDVVGEVVRLIADGVHRAKPRARVVAWDWSWTIIENDPQAEMIAAVPGSVELMVDFERGLPIERAGVRSVVDEYSLSVVGPSPRASAHIQQARERGMHVMAKIQVGTTWELGLLPYIPVAPLIARKFESLRSTGIRGAMMSWTLGTYPSPNWQVAQAFYREPAPDAETILREVAANLYGEKAANDVRAAWDLFVKAFERYPFSNALVYSSVVQCGPAHPMYVEPSRKRTGILNSQDSLNWTHPFGPEVVAKQFEEMAEIWQSGLTRLERAVAAAPSEKRPEATRDFAISQAVHLYFKSIANQVRFLVLRRRSKDDPARLPEMGAVVEEEIELATRLYSIARTDSRIGFEPSVQYFYLPHDIRERIAACRHMRRVQIPQAMERARR